MSFYELCKRLRKPTGYIRLLQQKLGLHTPVNGEGYGPGYLAFLRTVVVLRTFSVSMDDIRELFEMEKKLLVLLKVDSLTSSKTWYVDACAAGGASEKRLLLTHYDIGQSVTPNGVQFHLDFSGASRELFADHEMGADARRVLARCGELRERIVAQVKSEEAVLEDALVWSDELRRSR